MSSIMDTKSEAPAKRTVSVSMASHHPSNSSIRPSVTEEGHPRFLGLSGTNLNLMVAFAAGVGFVLFGYDQGVMGSLLTLPAFLQMFPEMNGNTHSTMQGAIIGIYEIGCFIGAISCLLWGNALGRRKVIWIGSMYVGLLTSSFMAVGAILQVIGQHIALLWVGRVIAGIGNGQHTSTIPVWQSECSPPHRRGMLIMIEGSLIAFGIMVSYWVDFALYWADNSVGVDSRQPEFVAATSLDSVSWRFPIAFQLLLILPTFLTIWLPESPRWLLLRGRETEARQVLSALHEKSPQDDAIDLIVEEIQDGLVISQATKLSDLVKQGSGHNFHRTALAFVIQMFQQISGINLMYVASSHTSTYYAGSLFERNLGLAAVESRILAACNGTEYFLASVVAIFAVERLGRRKLMLFGAVGMSLTMAVLTGVLSESAMQYKKQPVDAEMCRIAGGAWCDLVPGHARHDRNGYAVAGAVMLYV